jgi:flagellar assembly factor FliW
MPVVETKNFGRVEYEAEATLEFPRGLPGFEERRGFLPLHQPENDPLIFLQSLEDPELCFVTAPVHVVDAAYRFAAEADDLASVGLPASPRMGEEAFCLVVLSIREEGPTANLLAPVVVNPATRQCVQAVAPSSGYSHRHPLGDQTSTEKAAEEAIACS